MPTEVCVFCRIANGDSDAAIVYRDEQVIAFRDIRPVAPIHVLIVPIKHIASLNDALPEDETLLTHLLGVARQVAVQEGVAAGGYRLVLNSGKNGGQSVFHLHVHLLGGRSMQWPPG